MTFESIIERLSRLDTASLADANKVMRVVDPAIHPLLPGLKMIGRARTVECEEDFLTVIQALADSEDGEVLVIDTKGSRGAVAGELFSTECVRRGVVGMVIDGFCRDTAKVREMKFPIYSRGSVPRSGTAQKLFQTQIPVECGGVIVSPGDIIFGDGDGLIVTSRAELEEFLPLAEEIQRKEEAVLKEIEKGVSLFDFLNFEEHIASVKSGEESKLKFQIE